MDIGEVSNAHLGSCNWWEGSGMDHSETQDWGVGQGGMDAMGKGKAFAKGGYQPGGFKGGGKTQQGGFSYDCYNCGQKGHLARNCPNPKGGMKGKGESKGKAEGKSAGKGFQGVCYTCGKFGHSQANCWHNGKGGKGGKGGISQVDVDYWTDL